MITETDEGEFTFRYDAHYIYEHPDKPISLTMLLIDKSYSGNRLFPFFEGLIPEGWLLDIASKN